MPEDALKAFVSVCGQKKLNALLNNVSKKFLYVAVWVQLEFKPLLNTKV